MAVVTESQALLGAKAKTRPWAWNEVLGVVSEMAEADEVCWAEWLEVVQAVVVAA